MYKILRSGSKAAPVQLAPPAITSGRCAAASASASDCASSARGAAATARYGAASAHATRPQDVPQFELGRVLEQFRALLEQEKSEKQEKVRKKLEVRTKSVLIWR